MVRHVRQHAITANEESAGLALAAELIDLMTSRSGSGIVHLIACSEVCVQMAIADDATPNEARARLKELQWLQEKVLRDLLAR